jgi:hypothetical protein
LPGALRRCKSSQYWSIAPAYLVIVALHCIPGIEFSEAHSDFFYELRGILR